MNPYPSYKESGVEWIGEIPDDWTTNKIKYLTDGKKDSFIDGDWIESTNISESGIRYITTGNIGEGVYKEQGKGYISEETFEKLDCTEVFSGDLVISRLSPPVGRSCIIPNLQTRIVTSVDNVILRPKKDIDKNFLNFIFNSQGYYSHTDLISRGTTLTRISRTMLGNNKIVLPPLQEQEQISNYLEIKTQKIDSLIDKTQQKIELLKEQRISLINHLVTKGVNPDVEMKDSGVEWIGEIPSGWILIKLHTLISTDKIEFQDGNHGGEHPNPEEFEESGVPFIKPKDIQNGKINWGKCDRLPFDRCERFRIGFSNNDDVLLVNRGGSIGKVCYVSDFDENCSYFVINPQVTYIRGKNGLLSKFLYYISISNIFQCGIDLVLGHGSTFPFLGLSNMGDFEIVFPVTIEQQQIVEYLDEQTQKIDSTIEKETQRIDLLKEYRQSLISDVVTGKVDVRDEVVV